MDNDSCMNLKGRILLWRFIYIVQTHLLSLSEWQQGPKQELSYKQAEVFKYPFVTNVYG